MIIVYYVISQDNLGETDTQGFITLEGANKAALERLAFSLPRKDYEIISVCVKDGDKTLWSAKSDRAEWLNKKEDFEITGGTIIRPLYASDIIERFPETEKMFEFFKLVPKNQSHIETTEAYHGTITLEDSVIAEYTDKCSGNLALIALEVINEKGAENICEKSFHGNVIHSAYEATISEQNANYWLRFLDSARNKTKTDNFAEKIPKRCQEERCGC